MTYQVTSDNTFTLLDMLKLWDNSTAKAPNPIPACENLLARIADTIGQASDLVDVALMWQFGHGLPSDDFRKL